MGLIIYIGARSIRTSELGIQQWQAPGIKPRWHRLNACRETDASSRLRPAAGDEYSYGYRTDPTNGTVSKRRASGDVRGLQPPLLQRLHVV